MRRPGRDPRPMSPLEGHHTRKASADTFPERDRHSTAEVVRVRRIRDYWRGLRVLTRISLSSSPSGNHLPQCPLSYNLLRTTGGPSATKTRTPAVTIHQPYLSKIGFSPLVSNTCFDSPRKTFACKEHAFSHPHLDRGLCHPSHTTPALRPPVCLLPFPGLVTAK